MLENGASGYLDLIAGEDYYVEPSARTTSETGGYLAPSDDGRAPQDSYVVLVPSPPPSRERKRTGTGARSPADANTGYLNTGYLTPYEGDQFVDMSAGSNKSSSAGAPLQLAGCTVGSSNTDSIRYSNQSPDNDYLTPGV